MGKDIFTEIKEASMNRKEILKGEDPKIAELVSCLKNDIGDLIENSIKFDKGINTAGVRTRVELQKIVYNIKLVRNEILKRAKIRKARP